MIYRESDESILLKERSRAAVGLAMEGRWQEAADLNREILESCPDNQEALNRLGKALLELGDTQSALESFGRSLDLDPANPIALKNTQRLASEVSSTKVSCSNSNGAALNAKVFMEDSGKSAQVVLMASENVGRPSPGTPVRLDRTAESALAVSDLSGRLLGLVPSKLARRLNCLIDGGNRYDGAVSGMSHNSVRVVLREAYQDPSQRSKLSFPPTSIETDRYPSEPAPTADEEEFDQAESVETVESLWADEKEPLDLVSVGATIDSGFPDDLSDNSDDEANVA